MAASKRYLDRHFDPRLAVRHDVTIEDIEVGERLRLASLVGALRCAKEMRRRLGPDATRDEAARDKVIIRRLEHVFNNALNSWCEPDTPVAIPSGESARKRGATTEWENWAEDHIRWLDTRLRYMATYAKRKRQTKWGCRAIVRLENEKNWVQYALRD